MSRIGKKEINLPEGVSANFEGSNVTVSGKLGSLSGVFPQEVSFLKEDKNIKVSPLSDSKKAKAMWGLARSLLNNMVIGVSEGFSKRLEIHGVGYKASVDNKYLTLNLGFSHEIKYEIPEGISIKAEKPTLLVISGVDKQKVGEVAAEIIKQRPPEPYKGKGIRYEGEQILRKEGKKK
ncbi:MAG: 50S ribosomal protein L6 [Rickettsiales bacterium]